MSYAVKTERQVHLSQNHQRDLSADAGEILIDGKVVEINSPMRARSLGISMINQELSFVPEMTVAENFVMGAWPVAQGGVSTGSRFDSGQDSFGR